MLPVLLPTLLAAVGVMALAAIVAPTGKRRSTSKRRSTGKHGRYLETLRLQ